MPSFFNRPGPIRNWSVKVVGFYCTRTPPIRLLHASASTVWVPCKPWRDSAGNSAGWSFNAFKAVFFVTILFDKGLPWIFAELLVQQCGYTYVAPRQVTEHVPQIQEIPELRPICRVCKSAHGIIRLH